MRCFGSIISNWIVEMMAMSGQPAVSWILHLIHGDSCSGYKRSYRKWNWDAVQDVFYRPKLSIGPVDGDGQTIWCSESIIFIYIEVIFLLQCEFVTADLLLFWKRRTQTVNVMKLYFSSKTKKVKVRHAAEVVIYNLMKKSTLRTEKMRFLI